MKHEAMGPRAAAAATGVSPDTLRHYERLGLLPRVARTTAGYRRYDAAVIARVHLIQRAIVVGFSLKELASLLKRRDAGDPPCRSVRALVAARLETLEQRLQQLEAIRNGMRTLLDDWDARLSVTPAGQRARLLDMLEGRAEFDQPRTPASVSVSRAAPLSRSRKPAGRS